MVRRKPTDDPIELPPPAKTIEGRNDQLISMAFDLVARRISEGTASAQETVHFLKLGSVNARLEREKLEGENLLLQTRVRELESRRSGEAMYAEALAAFRGYSGQVDPFAEEDDDYTQL